MVVLGVLNGVLVHETNKTPELGGPGMFFVSFTNSLSMFESFSETRLHGIHGKRQSFSRKTNHRLVVSIPKKVGLWFKNTIENHEKPLKQPLKTLYNQEKNTIEINFNKQKKICKKQKHMIGFDHPHRLSDV